MNYPPARSRVHGLAVVGAAVALTILARFGDMAVHAQDVEAAKASVVRVVSMRRTGTGFVVRVDPDLVYIVTASHVIQGDPAPEVEFFTRRNRRVAARIVKLEADDPRGIGLIAVHGKENIPQGLQALPFAATEDLKGGQDVIAIGFGQGQGDWAVIRANVASIDGRDIKLDGRIEEGNSGGPILRGGQVVGLITRAQGVGQATPAPLVELTLRGWGLVPSRSDPPPSDQRYDLRYVETQGHTTLSTSVSELRDGTLTLDGVRQPDPMSLLFNDSVESETLRVSNGEPTRVRKKFLAKSSTFTRGAGRQRRETAGGASPLQGRTVIGESFGGQWSYSSPDGTLSPTEREELDQVFTAEDGDLYPPGPVPIGHEWEVSGPNLRRSLGLDTRTTIDGSMKMRFRRIASCGSEQCAEIEVRLRVETLTVMADSTQLRVSHDGQGVALRSLRDRIDVRSSMTGHMVYSLSGPATGRPSGINMTVVGPFTNTGTISLR